jgi:hypothetical protein
MISPKELALAAAVHRIFRRSKTKEMLDALRRELQSRTHIYAEESPMSKRYIEDFYWDDTYVQSLPGPTQYVYLYLIITCQYCGLGITEKTPEAVARTLGLPKEDVAVAFEKLEKDEKLKRDGSYLLLVNYVKHNWNPGPFWKQKVEKELKLFSGRVALLEAIFLKYQQHLKGIPIQPINPPLKVEGCKVEGCSSLILSSLRTKNAITFDCSPLSDWKLFDQVFADFEESERRFWYGTAITLAETKGYKSQRWDITIREWRTEPNNRYQRSLKKPEGEPERLTWEERREQHNEKVIEIFKKKGAAK